MSAEPKVSQNIALRACTLLEILLCDFRLLVSFIFKSSCNVCERITWATSQTFTRNCDAMNRDLPWYDLGSCLGVKNQQSDKPLVHVTLRCIWKFGCGSQRVCVSALRYFHKAHRKRLNQVGASTRWRPALTDWNASNNKRSRLGYHENPRSRDLLIGAYGVCRNTQCCDLFMLPYYAYHMTSVCSNSLHCSCLG